MDEQVLITTRLALHGVAELLLAGPQYRLTNDIRLQVTPGGFGTVREPGLRVDGDHLVAGGSRLPLVGTIADLGTRAGVEASPLRDVYQGGPEFATTEPLEVDAEAAALLVDAFGKGDLALRTFAPDEERVLWPEHFDVGATVGEVNYGVSPGDSYLAEPYAYVGPWQPRTGEFWNASFGAAVPLAQLPDADAIVDFFRQGREKAAQDPKR